MYAWSTPTLTLRIKDRDLTAYEVTVSIAQAKVYGGETHIDIEDGDLDSKVLDGDDTLVTVTLTQQQTGKLARGVASVQINAIDSGGNRVPTKEATVYVYRNLLDHAISYGGGDA